MKKTLLSQRKIMQKKISDILTRHSKMGMYTGMIDLIYSGNQLEKELLLLFLSEQFFNKEI